MLKRTVSLMVAVLLLSACGGGGGGTSSEHASAPATPKPSGLGTLADRTFGDLEARITAPEIAGDNYTGVMIALTDRQDKPVDGASIKATSSMPEHQMDGPEFKSEAKGDGKYWMPGEMMKGKWWLNLTVKTAQGREFTDTAEVVLP
jgi:hypothetical protein